MLFPIICGSVGMWALYRSMSAPHFLYSRMLIWIALGLVSYFRVECNLLCADHRMIASLQFVAAALLAGGIVLYSIHCEIRLPVQSAAQTFQIDVEDDTPAAIALLFSWCCIIGSMALGVLIIFLL